MKEITVIYSDGWMSGSHYHAVTRMKHVLVGEVEDVSDALDKEGIDVSQVWFILDGHCKEMEW